MTLLPILLPDGFKSKVAVNDKITVGKVLAEKTITGKDEVIHLSKDLNVSPKATIKCLKKSLGSKLTKGDIIAVKKGKFGMGKKQIIGEFDGTIVRLEEDTGDLFVRMAVNEETVGEPIVSPVDGVVDFCDNEKIVLKTEKPTILVKRVSGKSIRGEFLIFNNKEVEDEDIKKEVNGKIIVGKVFEKAAIFKILAIGGLGIVTLDKDDKFFDDILVKNLSGPLFLLAEENYKLIEKHQGKQAYLDVENKAIVVL